MATINALTNAMYQFMIGAPDHVWVGWLVEAGRSIGLPM